MKNCLIIVDSKDRINGDSGNFIYSPQTLGLSNVKKFRINKVSVPYSFYSILDQTFQVTVGTTSYVVTVLGGNYTAFQIATILQNTINGEIGGGLIVTYDQTSNNFNFFNSNSLPMQFNFNFGSLPDSYIQYNVGVQIGYITANNPNEVLPPSNNIFTKYAANMSATTNIYLRSNALSVYYMSYFRGQKNNVVASVPVNVNAYNWIIYSEFSPLYFDFDGQTLNQIDMQFLDDSGNVIDFRGLNPIIEIDVVFQE